MEKKKSKTGNGNLEYKLRDVAKGKLPRSPGASGAMQGKTLEEVIHELQVHQIELEMHNEELRRAQVALEESRQRYSDLYDFSPVGYFTFTPEDLIKEVNLSGAALLGVYRQKLINGRFRQYVSPSDFELWDRHFLKVLKEEKKQACDLRLKRQDGSTLYARLESIRKDGSQGVSEVHTVISDITEPKQAEKLLRASEERYRDLVENSQDLICTHDLEGNLLSVNEAPVRALGYSREFLLKVKMKDLLTPEQQERFGAYLKEIREKGRANGILRVQTAGGETRFWEYNTILRTEGLITPIVHGMAHDITERRTAELALRKSEERYRLHFENVSDVIFSYDREFRITSISPSLERILGYKPEEFVGKSFAELSILPPESLEKALSDALRVLAGEHLDSIIYKLIARDGTIKYGEFNSTPLIQEGLVAAVVSVGRDITERRHMEDALRESEQRYRSLFENSVTGISQALPDGKLVTANAAYAKMYGYSNVEEMMAEVSNIGQQLYANPEERDEVMRILAENGVMKSREIEVVRRDGTRFTVLVGAREIRDPEGNLQCYQAEHLDVTESKHLKEALQESDERYKALFDRSLDLVYIYDFEGRFIDANNAALNRLGYKREEIPSLNFASLLGKEQLPRAFQILQEIRETGIQKDLAEFRLQRQDGTEVYVETQGSTIISNGTPVAIQAIARDITERKQAEDRLNQTLTNLRKAIGGIIQVIAGTVETRDPYTAGHQRWVTNLAWAITGEMGMAEDQREGLRMAGSIHDLGKIAIPAEILNKPVKLSGIEYQMIRAHPRAGYDILQGIEFPWPIAEMILQHHERMDGSGYPLGLKGEEISPQARILIVADVVAAMSAYRPYRPALGIEAALEEIEKNKGILYDAEVAEVCLKLFREKGFVFE